MKQLFVRPIQTRVFHPREDLTEFLVDSLIQVPLQDGDVLAITSKIVSLAEGQLVLVSSIDKTELVRRESDVYLGEIGYGCHLTVKHGLLIPSAGIDESNAEDNYYILFPRDPFESARRIWTEIKTRLGLRHLGILLTDSHTSPLRKGVTGTSLAHWGFRGVQNFVGKPDLFGRKLKMTQINIADALATAAVLMMGESNECSPIAIVRSSGLEYVDHVDPGECAMPLEEDLYAPILKPLLSSKGR